jgi:hypothetical protein
MRDEPDADAMPAARPRRQVGQTAMTRAVGWCDNWIVAKSEIAVLRGAKRPAAARWLKREDGEGGCRGGLLRRRLDEKGSRRGAATYRGDRDGGGGLLDLGSRYHPLGQQAQHKSSAARDAATAIPPASRTPLVDGKPPGDVREAKRVERRTKLVRSRGGPLSLSEIFSKA